MKLEYDSIIIKLMLIILAFSSNCYMVHQHENINNDCLLLGTYRILGSQNMYVEILWKYMIHRSAEVSESNELHQDFVEKLQV